MGMTKLIALLYGVIAYFAFLATIVYAVGFVSGFVVPKDIDTGPQSPVAEAVAVNLLLIALFAARHSLMARRQFKRWCTRYVPKPVERSTYVLFSSFSLMLLFWQWRPMPLIVWQISNPDAAATIAMLSLFGWIIVFASTFLSDHFKVFGWHQVDSTIAGRDMRWSRFHTPLFYKFVRHPIYLGMAFAVWATPIMTLGHLLFVAVATACIFFGLLLEGRDIIEMLGDEYRQHGKSISMLLPWRRNSV
jgi:protein-S-isoprenylcysteine O-methyltransferase Ste14